MATKKKGFIARMIEGPERSETYARSTLPGNRWELGWDVMRNNFGKIVGLNLLMLVFCLPLIILFVLRFLYIQGSALTWPFSQNVGVGYPSVPAMPGLVEYIKLLAMRRTLIFIPVAGAIASVGISGGMYVMRNMVWAEGVIVGKDFWTGVKKNYFVVFLSTLIYTVFLTMCLLSISVANYITASGKGTWWLTVSEVISYILLVFISVMYLYTLTFGVTYKLKFRYLIKNSFIMALALLPTNLFFGAFALITIILMFLGGRFFGSLAGFAFVFLGLSGAALVWTDYCQWGFDKYINDKVPGAVKNRGIYNKDEDVDKDFSFERSSLGKRPIKPITDYDVEIFEIPETFSRADLQKLEESKAAMRKDSDDYVNNVLAGVISENNDVKDESTENITDDNEISSDNSDVENNDADNKADDVATEENTDESDVESIDNVEEKEDKKNNKKKKNKKSNK